MFFFFFSSRRRHTRSDRDWSSDVCSSDLVAQVYSSIGYSGPNRAANPNWANIFNQLPGPVGEDAVFGSCGDFDQALTTVLGPDPAEHPHGAFQCTPQPATGPVPAGGPLPPSSPPAPSGSSSPPPRGGPR